jgi:threonine dehydrogenase-like Zn-dependent dehydrogenase
MRAVVMHDAQMAVAEVFNPVPGPGEVLVDVLTCGICGTDLHCASHGPEFNASTRGAAGIELMDLSRPIVFGHEFVGRVVGYGPATPGRIPIGRRVVSMPILLREQQVMLGFAGAEAPGGYAEQMVLSEPLLIEVPGHVRTEVVRCPDLAPAPHSKPSAEPTRTADLSDDESQRAGGDYQYDDGRPKHFVGKVAHQPLGLDPPAASRASCEVNRGCQR